MKSKPKSKFVDTFAKPLGSRRQCESSYAYYVVKREQMIAPSTWVEWREKG